MELIIDNNLVGCGVYKITIGEYFYIGSSKNLQKRVKEHKNKINSEFNTNSNFLKIKDYAKDKVIKIELLEFCSNNNLLEKEFDYIKQNNSSQFMLNIKNGISLCQISATLSNNTIDSVKSISKELNKSFSETIQILLDKAIKVRNRRNRKKTKNNLED